MILTEIKDVSIAEKKGEAKEQLMKEQRDKAVKEFVESKDQLLSVKDIIKDRDVTIAKIHKSLGIMEQRVENVMSNSQELMNPYKSELVQAGVKEERVTEIASELFKNIKDQLNKKDK